MHFYELLEQEIDFEIELSKLRELCDREFFYRGNYYSVTKEIEKRFLEWDNRRNYTSFSELERVFFSSYNGNDLEFYLIYAELILNLVFDLQIDKSAVLTKMCFAIDKTIKAIIAKAGMEIRETEKGLLIVKQNALSIEMADNYPDIADVIIEYNHYLLRGNLTRKKEILKAIADSLEPKRNELEDINKSISDDFFFLVNNMNIRHNNCDRDDLSKYNPKFDSLIENEKEKIYDITYGVGLTLYALLEHQNRIPTIANMKRS